MAGGAAPQSEREIASPLRRFASTQWSRLRVDRGRRRPHHRPALLCTCSGPGRRRLKFGSGGAGGGQRGDDGIGYREADQQGGPAAARTGVFTRALVLSAVLREKQRLRARGVQAVGAERGAAIASRSPDHLPRVCTDLQIAFRCLRLGEVCCRLGDVVRLSRLAPIFRLQEAFEVVCAFSPFILAELLSRHFPKYLDGGGHGPALSAQHKLVVRLK